MGASAGIIVGWALTLIALERRFPYTRGQKLFRPGFFDDLVLYTLVQSWLLGHVIGWIITGIDASVGRLHLVSGWPIWAQLVFFFVTHDFYIYWFHRAQHHNRWLWRIHEAHHSTRDVDWLSGSRSHSIEILINQTIEFAPIVLLGGAPEVAVMKGTIDAVWGMWIHSNVDVRTGLLQRVFNGPEMHRWHHAIEITEGGINFGTKLAIWDWLFGTAVLPDEKPRGFGLVDDRYPSGWLQQHLYAFRRSDDNAARCAPPATPIGATTPISEPALSGSPDTSARPDI